jgi:signal transduction histidine kinase
MGPGMSSDLPHFGRRARVSQFVRKRIAASSAVDWEARIRHYEEVPLDRGYTSIDMRLPTPSPEELSRLLAELGKPDPSQELNCGACGYASCRELASAIYRNLAEREMCLPHSIEQLRSAVSELARSNEDLANAQVALVRSEKLASMGQLAAGIAHEVNNPLGVVIMYSHFLAEQLAGKPEYRDDLSMVVEQADRCKKIVAGLLDFARQNKVEHDRIHLHDLVQRGLRGLAHPLGVEIEVEHAAEDPYVDVDPDQITQVLVNLISNAFAAMPDGGHLKIRTDGSDDQVRITVTDTGTGIKPEHFSKLFEPFFTTKKEGKGTGLGLAVTYGIVKMHRGDIKVSSNADPATGPTGTTFTVILPRRRAEASSAA